MGKHDLANDVEQKIEGQQQIKSSLQAMHLKEEQNNLPPEVTYVFI